MSSGPVQSDIVIPVYGQAAYTRACVDSILAYTSVPFRLIIVDDASQEAATLDYLKDLQVREPSRVLVLRHDKNQGYVGAVNHGLERTSAEFVVVMNNDTLVYPGWLAEMISVARQDPMIGVVDPQCEVPKYFRGGPDQYARQCALSSSGRFIETDWARGFCYLTKRCVIDRIGGLDQDFSPAYYDDWDYSMRAMASGYRCVRALGAFVFHLKNVTYSTCGEGSEIDTLLQQKGRIFYKRWGKPLRMLIVDDGTAGDISGRLQAWLRDQNKMVLVSPFKVDMAHTNLKVVKVSRWLMNMVVLWILLDNARYSAAKRFHLVLMGEGRAAFVRRAFFGRDRWIGLIDIKDSQGIDQRIKELKFS